MVKSEDAAVSKDSDEKSLQKRLKRRPYIRSKMREYREKEKLELAYLRAHAQALDAELRHFTKQHQSTRSKHQPSVLSPLSWQHVKDALHGARNAIEADRESLTNQVEDAQEVVREMTTWVAMHRRIPPRPNAATLTWQDVTLLANPTSRQLGKLWIAQQMYFNATNTFKQYGFPAVESTTSAPFLQADCILNDDMWTYCSKNQFMMDARLPFQLLLATFKQHLCHTLLLARNDAEVTLRESEGPTSLHQTVTVDNEAINLLCGCFADEGRAMVVVTQIQQDEMWVHDLPQRHRIMMFELNRLGDGRTVMRMLHSLSQKHTSSGVLPLVDEAKFMGLDLSGIDSEALKMAKYRHARLKYGQNLFHQTRAKTIQLAMANMRK
ncbi:hypothetical protein DYB37_009391 [Aphanomyces astaci]|uniref:Uncharacterized protein n=2 Tax=Aphanomyces astaci TaxID=112090 RepID=A0A3R6X610_APHAT|nr:hypothetical protein DYB37_009391 [Aphanomyces astaci]